MKILVLSNDLKERTVIQQVLQNSGHEIVTAEDSETAMRQLQEGGIHFVIADRAGTDIDERQFIKRVRDAKPPYYIYILLATAKVQETDVTLPRASADDYIHKPVIPIELKSRVHIGERILNLRDRLVQAKDTLDNSALLDPLNVLNQRAFLIASRGELERARRGQSPFSLIALSVDNFRSIKDQHGEDIGNDVLTVIAKAIREKSRPYDGVGRYANEFFLIALPGVIGQDAEKIADRILKGIFNTSVSLLDGSAAIQIGVSAGISCATHITAATEIETLIQRAQEAVAHAQREGGNQSYIVFI